MQKKYVTYKTKTVSEKAIYEYLKNTDSSFLPPLNSKVNIEEYSKKIFNNAITFEAWIENKLVGLIATYFNFESKLSFITSVSVKKEYMGLGIATKLLIMCLDYSKNNNFKNIKLEVFKDNIVAIKLYEKHNFTKTNTLNDLIIMDYSLI